MRIFLSLLALIALTVLVWAQDPAQPASPEAQAKEAPSTPAAPSANDPAAAAVKPETEQVFRVQTQEVIVPVTVTDPQGRFISDLDKKDFRIFDEDTEQEIQFFTRERNQPVVVGFLLDMSNRMRIHWKTFQEATMEMVWTLMPGDQRFSGYLITYGTKAEVAVNTTSNYNDLVDKIRVIKPGGGSALFDAIYFACTQRELVKGEPIEPRRVLIIIGDGHDNASSRSLDEVIEIAQRNLVTIYGISTVAFGFDVDGEKNLKRLAEETGGRVEYPLEGLYKDVSGYLSKPQDAGNFALTVGSGAYAAEVSAGIFRAVAALTGEITTQYILRYVPNYAESDRQYRRIRVEAAVPNATVRTRKGYYVPVLQDPPAQ